VKDEPDSRIDQRLPHQLDVTDSSANESVRHDRMTQGGHRPTSPHRDRYEY
jgi:hypothetical protein